MPSWPTRSIELLVVGFYLINVGFVALALKYGEQADRPRRGDRVLSTKEGLVLLVLGGMHFINLYVFSRVRRRGLLRSGEAAGRAEAFVEPRVGWSHCG